MNNKINEFKMSYVYVYCIYVCFFYVFYCFQVVSYVPSSSFSFFTLTVTLFGNVYSVSTVGENYALYWKYIKKKLKALKAWEALELGLYLRGVPSSRIIN